MVHAPSEAVRSAVAAYEPPEGYTLVPKSKRATSPMYQYGVRVQQRVDGKDVISWVCLASDICRAKNHPLRLSSGRTSRAMEHLTDVRDVVSLKTAVTKSTKTRREETLSRYKTSPLYRQDPSRFVVLLETLRAVYNYHPYRSVEYEESILLRELCYAKELKTAVNTKILDETIYELYITTKWEVFAVIAAARMAFANFSLVVDFWTSKVQTTKYIGIRLYMVDQKYNFQSILLGTRAFDPQFGDRDKFSFP